MQFYGKIAYSIVQFLKIFAYSIMQNCKFAEKFAI